jgi:outer membrane protein assembly factor BamB
MMKQQRYVPCLLILLAGVAVSVNASGLGAAEPANILTDSGVKGGLVVVIGCGDPNLLAGLHGNESYLVHGLDVDLKRVDAARKQIMTKGLYGKVSVDVWDGKTLPYADNIVNLLINADPAQKPTDSEINRAVAPRGVAMNIGAKLSKTVKPVPANIDEWTHFMHGPDNNASAKDSVVGFPRYLQWRAGPFWGRHHNTVQGVEAIVSSGGRIFYIVDEAAASIDDSLPDKWMLVARDAFSGVLLWKKPMNKFGWEAWSDRGALVHRFSNPKQMHRRLVAVGDKVYVTLGFNAPVSVLDGATGQLIRTCKGTQATTEIIHYDGKLILGVKRKPTDGRSHAIMAVQPSTGKVIWESKKYKGCAGLYSALPDLFVTVGGRRVFFMDDGAVIGLDLDTGKELWRWELASAPNKNSRKPGKKKRGGKARSGKIKNNYATLIYHKGIVYLLQPRGRTAKLDAISAESGKTVWTATRGAYTYGTHSVMFVAQGLLWVHDAKPPFFVGLDPATGKLKRSIDVSEAISASGGHMRCYPGRATDHGLWTSIGGKPQQVIDLDTGENCSMPWLRAGCRVGMMPCNGLAYITPHPCACHIEVKLNGLLAIASQKHKAGQADKGPKLEKGPAFDKIATQKPAAIDPGDWPMYRHDPARSCLAKTAVPTKLKSRWQVNVGGKLTQPVIAAGKVFVASIDTHTVHALDVDTGKSIWSFTCGGRVDTPPTIRNATVMFGSNDGWVYCLDAADGKLAWRFRVAPNSRRIVSYGQLESCWPVSGSVLIRNNRAVVAAGRTSYLDGGIYLYVLDPATGRIVKHKNFNTTGNKHPKDPPLGVVSDVLVGDGKSVYMRFSKINLTEMGIEAAPKQSREKLGGGVAANPHGTVLVSADRMPRDGWFHRAGLMYGKASGQALVTDGNRAYSFKAFAKWNLHSTPFAPGKQKGNLVSQDASTGKTDWSVHIPLLAKAMVLTEKNVIVAGAPDTLDPSKPWSAFDGLKGAKLTMLSRSDGSPTGTYELPAAPVHDGMAAAHGKLFISLQNGKLVCLD